MVTSLSCFHQFAHLKIHELTKTCYEDSQRSKRPIQDCAIKFGEDYKIVVSWCVGGSKATATVTNGLLATW